MGRAMRMRDGAREDMRLARITFEITSPVPLKPLTVSTGVLRQGRSVELVEASLTPEGGDEVMRARALRIRTLPGAVPESVPEPEVPGPESAAAEPFFPVPWEVGYHTAMEARFAHGSFLGRGPAACWLRMRVPLVEGEKTAPLDRALIAADSGNGVSNVLDFSQHLFVNPDLTVHLHRHPGGEWVCVDARTSIDDAGIGMTETVLHDEQGPIGRSVQSLFVAPRG
nr:thioesterase family protein [Streptomyces sp. HNM0575]